jgi:segregation and condensation protein A
MARPAMRRSAGEIMADYKVKFEVFEGPLDLLLYLIKREEVDIYEVNLTKLATQFIEYIDTMRTLDLEIAGEFLVMASTLMYIKSRELLPVDQQAQIEGDEEGEDPRWELIRQLVEYKKFKDAASRLQALEAQQENIFPRLPAKLEFAADAPAPRPEVSLFDLINAVNNVLKRFTQREDLRDIFEDKWTVSEKIEHLLRTLTERGRMKFSELFEGVTTRSEVVVTFLALLELIRLKQLTVAQPEAFGQIEICRALPAASAPVPETLQTTGEANSTALEEISPPSLTTHSS